MIAPPTNRIDKLFFVYNANSGPVAALVDGARKLLRVNGCVLCEITHGVFGERSQWKECREELGVPIESVHRDDVGHEVRQLAGDNLPCIVAEAAGEYVMLLTPDMLLSCRGSVGDLKARLLLEAAHRELQL